MDIEEQLDLFFIRKEDNLIKFPVNISDVKSNSKQDVRNCIPLLLKHIKSLKEKWEGVNAIKIFSEKMQFKHCLLYGKIVSNRKESKSSYSYILDDGTATVDITIFKKVNDMEAIWKMENELEAIKKEMLAQNKNEIVSCLRNLLFKTKEQIDNTNIPIGSKVILYGKPSCYRKQISVKVYSLFQDQKCNRDVEICFKDYLINWHNNNRLLTTNAL